MACLLLVYKPSTEQDIIKMKQQLIIWLFLIFIKSALAQVSDYNQLWTNPKVVDRIQTNIEKYRKGDAVIELVGKNGKPLPGLEITIQQQSNEQEIRISFCQSV
jgi:hypothetical protein